MTGRRVHHPTWDEYMKLTGGVPTGESVREARLRLAAAPFREQAAEVAALARKHLPVKRSMLRDGIKVVDGGPITAGFFYDHDMLVEQIAEITGRDHKRDHKPHRGCLGAACPVLPERTSTVRTGEVTWEVTREPAEPKGPLSLRVRLWWMRMRLRWMLIRLNGASMSALRGAS